MTQEYKPLLDAFPPADLETWRQEVERLLRGAPFAKKMFTETLEGITVGPMYTAKDTEHLPWSAHFPGQAPFVRGTHAAGYAQQGWRVGQEFLSPTVEEFNEAVRDDLKRGQNAICLKLDRATQLGMDPDQAEKGTVGLDGTSLSSLAELETALDGIDLEKTMLCLQPGSSALPMAALLAALFDRKGAKLEKLEGSLGCDPVSGLACKGLLPVNMSQLFDELAVLTRWAQVNAPGVATLPVHELTWHQGGADSALSLGLTLATAVETVRAMEQRDLSLEETMGKVRFRMVVGTDFFMEIAKLRALRVLWSDVAAACGCPAEMGRATVHAQTSPRCLTVLDTHVNILRTTTMAMSAVMGGVDSLQVSAFDEVDSIPDNFSRRIARNIQLMLAEECHFDQVADPAGGSWYVEKLTADLAEKAWTVFQEIEAGGGVVAGLLDGSIQKRVADQAEKRIDRLATGRDVLVGTTRYVNPAEPERQVRRPDLDALHARRAQDMVRQRTAAAHEDHLMVLKRLEKIMTADQETLMSALIDAAVQGATVGELTGILRHDADTQRQVELIPLRRDAQPFEELRHAVKSAARRDPARGKIFCACLGNFAGYMPRLDFVRGFFQVGGFEVASDTFYTQPDEAVAGARAFGAAVVVLVGLDSTYAELGCATAQKLKALSPAPTILMAGKPQENEEAFLAAGIDGFIHVRSNLLDELGALVRSTEVGE
jgi:methylmalonyl-CoA mutase|nr:methylmalonyl-CoA mutase family protein [Candidatus Krumholzibacteria bacterium]